MSDEKKQDPTEKPLRWSPPRRPTPRRGFEAPLQVFTAEERADYVPAVPQHAQRFDPSKLRVKREKQGERQIATGLGRFVKPKKDESGKTLTRTARDHAKAPSGQKTNDPAISQKMKGAKGSK